MSKLVSHSAAVRSRDGVFGKTLRQDALVVNQFNDKRIMRNCWTHWPKGRAEKREIVWNVRHDRQLRAYMS